MPSKNDFRTTATIQTLKHRAEIIKSVRHFFDERGFLEVETPILSHDIVVDRHLEPIPVSGDFVKVPATLGKNLWLQTSPEFAMKRVLASGADCIYQITKAFRGGESGERHNPEFTMLEWYRVGDDQSSGMALLSNFVQDILNCQPARTISYRQAFIEYADLDPFESTTSDFAKVCEAHQVDCSALAQIDDIDQWRNLVLSEIVESKLGEACPEIVYDWPASQSALAVTRPESPPVAERFELYVRGVELANGYHELVDAHELAVRNQIANQQRLNDGNCHLPAESQLLNAMQHGLPKCAGVALGIDRLVMLATNCKSISEVIAFDIDRA